MVPSPTVNGWQTLTITNQSSEVWLANGPYKVGYHLYDGGGHLINYEGLRTNLPFSIGPGQSETFGRGRHHLVLRLRSAHCHALDHGARDGGDHDRHRRPE